MFSLGIDGGGSTLRIGIYGESLKCIHLHELLETSNPSVLGFSQAEELLKSNLSQALNNAGIASSTVRYVGAGMAGTAQNPEWLRGILKQALPHAQVIVAPDYEIALIGAHGKRYGILVLSGTGSVACGINSSGDSAHSGGWGYLLGDGGSGYWLGMEMLKSATRVADGSSEKTGLYQQTFAHLKISNPDELISWLYCPERKNQEISLMAPLVLDCAESGDIEALRIIEDGAEELFQHYFNVVKSLNFTCPPVMFAGGLLSSDNLLRRLLMQKIGIEKVPISKYSPLEGAALMANISKNS